MATFKSRIEEYVGTTGDDTALSNWLTQGARLHVRIMPMQQLIKYASDTAVPTGGLAVANTVVLSVDKDGAPSTQYPSNMRVRLSDTNSIHNATAFSPAHVIHAGKIYVFPDGGNAETVELPDVLATDESISVLPKDLEDATVLYAAIQQLQKYLSDDYSSISVSFTLPTEPTLQSYPTAPTITITGSSVTPTTISDFGTAPSYTSPTAVTINASPTYSAPSKPSGLTSDYSDTDTRITDDDVEIASTIISKIQSEIREYATDVQEAVEHYGGDIDKWESENQLKLEQYGLELQDALNSFNEANTAYQAEIQKNIQQAQITLTEQQADATLEQQAEIEQAQSDLQKYAAQVQAIAQENVGLISDYSQQVAAQINKIRAEIEGYVAKGSYLLNVINSLRSEYQTLLSPYITAE